MSSADNYTHTVQWGNTAGEFTILQDGQLNHDANKIYYMFGYNFNKQVLKSVY